MVSLLDIKNKLMAKKSNINGTLVLLIGISVICVFAYLNDINKTPPVISHSSNNEQKVTLNESEWREAPPIKFKEFDGAFFQLDDYQGKVVLLNFT